MTTGAVEPVVIMALPDWVAEGLRAIRLGEGPGRAPESLLLMAEEASLPAPSIPSSALSTPRLRALAAAGSHQWLKLWTLTLEDLEESLLAVEEPPERPARSSAEEETGPSPRPVFTVGVQPLAPTSVVTLLLLP